MDGMPDDLVPLPTAPYAERPIALPLDVEECRTALWVVRGNITKAAEILKVSSNRLRKFIERSPYLSAELQEAKDRLVDIAEDNIYEALTDEEDKARRDQMSKFVLASVGKARGWGQGGSGTNVTIKNSSGGTIRVSWADGTQIGESSAASEDDPEASGGHSARESAPSSRPERLPDVVDAEIVGEEAA